MNSFQYFRLKQDAALSNPIRIFHFAVEGDYTEGRPVDAAIVPKQQVAYFEYSPQTELCEINVAPMYWCPMIASAACMDETTELYPDGTLKHLAIRFQAVQGRHIFQVAGISEPTVVVSLAVAESMLKRSTIGVELEAVDLV